MNPPPTIGVVMMVLGGPLRVLDHRTVVVHHVQRVVGPGGEVHGPEPGIPGGEELAALLRAARHEGGPGRRPDVPVHEVEPHTVLSPSTKS